jgi:hypothetical protein
MYLHCKMVKFKIFSPSACAYYNKLANKSTKLEEKFRPYIYTQIIPCTQCVWKHSATQHAHARIEQSAKRWWIKYNKRGLCAHIYIRMRILIRTFFLLIKIHILIFFFPTTITIDGKFFIFLLYIAYRTELEIFLFIF